jgi:hypothetical protein
MRQIEHLMRWCPRSVCGTVPADLRDFPAAVGLRPRSGDAEADDTRKLAPGHRLTADRAPASGGLFERWRAPGSSGATSPTVGPAAPPGSADCRLKLASACRMSRSVGCRAAAEVSTAIACAAHLVEQSTHSIGEPRRGGVEPRGGRERRQCLRRPLRRTSKPQRVVRRGPAPPAPRATGAHPGSRPRRQLRGGIPGREARASRIADRHGRSASAVAQPRFVPSEPIPADRRSRALTALRGNPVETCRSFDHCRRHRGLRSPPGPHRADRILQKRPADTEPRGG